MSILKAYIALGCVVAIVDIILYDDSRQSSDEAFYQCSKKVLLNLVAWPKTVLILLTSQKGQV